MRGRASKIKRIHQCKQDGRNRRHALEVEEEAHAPPAKEAPQDAPALQVGALPGGASLRFAVARTITAPIITRGGRKTEFGTHERTDLVDLWSMRYTTRIFLVGSF